MPANKGVTSRPETSREERDAGMRRVYAIEAWCVGCKRCEVACRVAHSETKHPVKAYLYEEDLLPSRVTVEGDRYLSIAVNCRHCDQPRCIEGCISGAMQKDPITGTVTSDIDRCVGCRTCVSFCPYGAVQIVKVQSTNSMSRRDKALKCDLCGAVENAVDDSECRVDSEGLADVGASVPCASVPSANPSCVAACPNRALIYMECEVA